MAVRNIRKQLAGVEDLLLGKGKQDQERSAGIVSITKIDIPAIVETIDELRLIDINKYTTAIVKDINNGGTFIYIANNLAINNGITIFNGWTRQIELPVIVVETIDDLSLIDTVTYSTAIVKDIDRGGTFIYDSSKVLENNGGTIFNGWVRQYDAAVNVKWFGAKGDGITDDRPYFQNALSYLKSTNGGTINITSGKYLLNSATNTVNNIMLVYTSNITIEMDNDSELIVGSFCNDQRFTLFYGDDGVNKNNIFRGGTISFSANTNKMDTSYLAPRIAIQGNNVDNLLIENITFKDGDLSNCIAVGSGTQGKNAMVSNCRFINLVQESSNNIDFTACYMNAENSIVKDCYFEMSSRRGGEIACAVELHKKNSRWLNSVVKKYTRGCFLVSIESEDYFNYNLEVSGIKAWVVNQFATIWIDTNCSLRAVNISNNIVRIMDRDATMTDTLYYGVGALVATAGTSTARDSSNDIVISNNIYEVGNISNNDFSTVLAISKSICGFVFKNNKLRSKIFLYSENKSNIVFNSCIISNNAIDFTSADLSKIYLDLTCKEIFLTEIDINVGIIYSIPTASTLVKVATTTTSIYNTIITNGSNIGKFNSPTLEADTNFLYNETNKIMYTTDIALFVPATTGVATINTVRALPNITNGKILSRGTLPANVYLSSDTLLLHPATTQLAGLAMYPTNVGGTYYVKMLLSNI